MKISNELMVKTYNHFNDFIFGNELPKAEEINLKVYSSKVNCGFFNGEPDDNGGYIITVRISKYHNKSYKDFCETLVHEMVHIFQYIKHLPVDHDKTFNKMAKAIYKQIGLDIN